MIRLLVVDDHPVVRAGMVAVLGEERDFEVVGEAANGAEALALVPRLRPDVVLMDLRMPVMDGHEAIRRIRVMPGGQETRIIAVTASAMDDNRQELMEVGADDYLAKPFEPRELLARVRALLRRGGGDLGERREFDGWTLDLEGRALLVDARAAVEEVVRRVAVGAALRAQVHREEMVAVARDRRGGLGPDGRVAGVDLGARVERHREVDDAEDAHHGRAGPAAGPARCPPAPACWTAGC